MLFHGDAAGDIGQNGPVPRYAMPPMPPAAERAVTLGIVRTKVTILIALADHGGQAQTVQIAERVQIGRSTLLDHLQQLRAVGYISAAQRASSDGAGGEEVAFQIIPATEAIGGGSRVWWILHTDQINADLQALMDSWTVRPASPDSR